MQEYPQWRSEGQGGGGPPRAALLGGWQHFSSLVYDNFRFYFKNINSFKDNVKYHQVDSDFISDQGCRSRGYFGC